MQKRAGKQKDWSAAHDVIEMRKEQVLGRAKYRMVPSQLGRWFQDAYDLRNKAHYGLADLSGRTVEKVFSHAKEFVKIVSEVVQR